MRIRDPPVNRHSESAAMDLSLEFCICEGGRLGHRARLTTAAEFGRQNVDEDAPYGQHVHTDVTRIVIARLDEVTVPRRLLRIDRLGERRVKLSNLSRIPLLLDSGPMLDPGAAREVDLPVTVTVGNKALAFRLVGEPEVESLPDSSYAPNTDPAASLLIASAARSQIASGSNLDNEKLLEWIQAALGVLRSAAGNDDFFRRAARALVDLIGFDYGCVLLREKERWVVHQQGSAGRVLGSDRSSIAASEWQPSHQIVSRVYREKKTYWQKLDSSLASESLVGIKSVIASPILNAAGDVIGALYGERRRGGPAMQPITRVEAMLVDLLAGGVAAGLARVEQEKTRFLWEQFVTPELSAQLAGNPDLLQGRDADVTMLSCDIRGFSRICANLGPTRTLEWLQNVLGTLTDCVMAEQGVLVDYVGDELLGMWGAPAKQLDHAVRACRAALAMQAAVPVLNNRWYDTVKEKMGLSIGINTGTARVGNVGSARKFKYGALGTTVNLASRVQGATKYLRVAILITAAVRERLDTTFFTRRLGQVKVVNIPDAVELCQLTMPGQEAWAGLKEGYEQALVQYENQEFRLAARILGRLLAEPQHGNDFPSQVLLQRAVTYMVEPPKEFSAVWELEGKGK
jgi:adenylate cyclase